ncbi:MAG: Hsp20/alpha crystallin family protein [Vicinamibacterales bacterium]
MTTETPVKAPTKAVAPAAWDPFSTLRRMTDEMDRFFGAFGHRRALLPTWTSAEVDWSPDVEVFERNGEFIVRADLPGLTAADVKVEVNDDVLTVEGERKTEKEEKKEGYFRSERTYGKFARAIALPDTVMADKTNATFKNGVLEIAMPMLKAPEPAKRRIDVKAS